MKNPLPSGTIKNMQEMKYDVHVHGDEPINDIERL